MNKEYKVPEGEIILTDEELITAYNRIYSEGMIWFIIGSLISSDNFFDIEPGRQVRQEAYDNMIKKYDYNIYKLYKIGQIITSCDKIPEEDQNKIKKHCEDGVELLEKEKHEKIKAKEILDCSFQ